MFESTGKIKQGKTLFAKEIEDVFMVWEALMEDTTIESIRENRRTTKEKIAIDKTNMKKLVFKEKVSKMTEIK